MSQKKKDSPGVIAPPPLIFVSGLLLGVILHWWTRFYLLPAAYLSSARILAGILIVFGLAIVFVAKAQMKRVKTNIEPWKPTTAIIDDGIYAYSRNPIYIAMILVYIGFVIIINSVWVLLLLPAVYLVMHFGVILREEKYLAEKFGEEYLNYKNKVRRWI
jgi:protein-S-isoprenylcysteine O-methyltransferase Ste14